MKFQEIEWRGFQGYEFEFEGLQAKLIKPNCKPNGKWMLKAEYFDAFPETELEIVPLSPAFITQGGPNCLAVQYIEK